MAFLIRQKKADLRDLAEEFSVQVEETDKILDLAKKIRECEDFEEEVAKELLKTIMEDRKEAEERAERELAIRKAEEKEELARNRAHEREIREYELERLRITQSSETLSVASVSQENGRPSKNIKSVMQRYDADKTDMALYLTLFERQARKLNIEEGEWVSQLLSLMPIDICEIVIKQPEDKSDCYTHIKSVLLSRFKLSPEAFRTKFQTHPRQNGALWQDLVFDLQSYLSGWLEGVKVNEFESLKDLMIADQIKTRAPTEMKEHFIDQWGNLIKPRELAEKLDAYEASRRFIKKPLNPKPPGNRFADKSKPNDEPKTEKKSENEKDEVRNSQRPNANNSNWRTGEFEKRKEPICYNCNLPGHIRPNCPELNPRVGVVNNLVTSADLAPSFEPYLSRSKVNNIDTVVLRDSGSSIDLGTMNLVRPEDFTGEHVWIKQPLDNHCRRLPLARIEIKSPEFGLVKTKAAIVDQSVDLGHYLLGNATQKRIDKIKRNPRRLKAVQTRSQAQETPGNRVRRPGPNARVKRERSATEADLKEKRETHYDKGSTRDKFKNGDKVFVRSSCQPNGSAVEWVGPGIIRRKLSKTKYIVTMSGEVNKGSVYHVNLLKPYCQKAEEVNILTRDEPGRSKPYKTSSRQKESLKAKIN